MSNVSLGNTGVFVPEMHSRGQNLDGSVKEVERVSKQVLELAVKGDVRRNDESVVAGKEISVNADALEKLFEMFDLVFKAMRSLLSGRGLGAKLAAAVPLATQPESVEGSKASRVVVGKDGAVKFDAKGVALAKTSGESSQASSVSVGKNGVVTVDAKGTAQAKTSGEVSKASSVSVGKNGVVTVDAKGTAQAKTLDESSKASSVTVGKDGVVTVDAKGAAQAKTSNEVGGTSTVHSSHAAQKQVDATGGTAIQMLDGAAQVKVLPDGSTQVSVTAEAGKQFNVRLNAGVHVRISSDDSVGNPSAVVSETGPRRSALVENTGEPQVMTVAQLKAQAKAGTESRVGAPTVTEPKPELKTADKPKAGTPATPEPKLELKTVGNPKVDAPAPEQRFVGNPRLSGAKG